MDILAVHVGAACAQHLAGWCKPARHPHNFRVLERTSEETVRRRALSHRNPDARAIDVLGGLQGHTGAADIAVVDFHEHVTEGEVLTSGRIARGEPDIPFILAEAFVVTRWIFVGHQTNW